LLTDIHAAIMSANPQPQLLGGDAAEIKKIPRSERRQIFVEAINTTYMSDLSSLLAASETEFKRMAGSNLKSGTNAGWGGGPEPFQVPGSVPGATEPDGSVPGAEKPRGYLVTLQLRTPNSGKFNFVYDTVIKSLEGIDLAAALPD